MPLHMFHVYNLASWKYVRDLLMKVTMVKIIRIFHQCLYPQISFCLFIIYSYPLWLSWQRICLQCGRPGFDPRVGRIPWRRERLPMDYRILQYSGLENSMDCIVRGVGHDWATFISFHFNLLLPLSPNPQAVTYLTCFLSPWMNLHFLKFYV